MRRKGFDLGCDRLLLCARVTSDIYYVPPNIPTYFHRDEIR